MNEIDNLFHNYLNHDLHISSENRFLYKFYNSLLPRVESLENSVSIIIQGPLNKRSINTIPYYLKYGEVVVSCWNTDDLSLLDEYKDKIKIVINNYHSLPQFHKKSGSQAPWIYQHYTTLSGLRKCKGYFCIKLRSDESFPILDPLIFMLRRNRDTYNEKTKLYNSHKIITSNIYFRFDRENKFHPSDHIISGQRDRMLSVFSKALYLCSKKNLVKFPEQLFCKAVIETFFNQQEGSREIMDNSKSADLMKKHFDIIRIKDLPKHIWTSSYRKYDALYNEEGWCHHIDLIDS